MIYRNDIVNEKQSIAEEIYYLCKLEEEKKAGWHDEWINLKFNIQYTTTDGETVTQSIHFIGERTWFDTFKWGGAIIEG